MQKHPLRIWIPVALAFASLWALSTVLQASALAGFPHRSTGALAAEPVTNTLLLPVILANHRTPLIEFSRTWTSRADNLPRQVFLPGEDVHLWFDSFNTFLEPKDAELSWQLDSSCAPPQVFTDTMRLYPGYWAHEFDLQTPRCLGIFTNTLEITSGYFSAEIQSRYIVNPLSGIVQEERQAFDRCRLPTVEQMQTWWQHSPYWTFNIYLGGISFYCWQNPLDAFWVHAVAQQGWSFILTWVGPQAPCSRYSHPMSWDPQIAYQQGMLEAGLAVARAEELGFLGEKVIYYDMESYSGATPSCRAAVDAFMTGWVVGLHALGVQAGGYGSACSSYLSDWADNNPAPDDIWIAHWYEDNYSPDASVWETPCLGDVPGPPKYWTNHQRLKQYAGDHIETWGGVAMTIDSNVMDGRVTALPMNESAALSRETVPLSSQPHIQAFDLVDTQNGWIILDGQLFWTRDQGGSWSRLGPGPEMAWLILATDFNDPQQGWLAARRPDLPPWEPFALFTTNDSGQTWQQLPFSSGITEYSSIQLEFIDSQAGWLLIRQPAGSSFSRGRLFATSDAGYNWQEYTVPGDGELHFDDRDTGWLLGGPDGQQLYQTSDRGQTWITSERLTHVEASSFQISWPNGTIASASSGTQLGWALTQTGTCQGVKDLSNEQQHANLPPWHCQLEMALWQTLDGGMTWIPLQIPTSP
ncbi:MAG: DUF1906 domain-containing protein [Anaerolineales bacterium]|nr:DUF1906 domain-containing protein [Anaerolineales bacterium]